MTRAPRRITEVLLVLAPVTVAAGGAAPSPATPLRLSLAETVERAKASSPRIARLRALERAADAGLAGARAQRIPSVDLSAGYTRGSDVPELTIPIDGVPRTLFPNIPDSYRARLGVAAPLYTGRRIEGGIDAASGEADAARKDVETGLGDLVLETTGAYWLLVTSLERGRVLREGVATFDSHLVDAENRARFGMAARNEVLTVQVERDRAELARLQAEHAAEVAHEDLVRLLELPPGTRVEPTEPLEEPRGGDEAVEPLVQSALAGRPERAALAARVAAARSRIAVERAARKPQVSAAAGYDYARPNPRIVPPLDEWRSSWSAGVGVSLSVFDGGRAAAAIAEASERAEALERQLQDLDGRIRLEVTARALEVRTARAAVGVAARNLEAAAENRRVSEDRYKAGVGLSSDLLDAETGLLGAGLDRAEALARLHVAVAGLDRAVGR